MSLGAAKGYLAFAMLCLLLGQGWLANVHAATRPAEHDGELVEFDISAQALSQALDSYSEATGVAVLVDQELTRARRSAGVTGRHTAREGLRLLLSGTGLMAVYSQRNAFTLRRAEVSRATHSTSPSKGSKNRTGGGYASIVQAALEHALCRSQVTRPGNYRVAFQVWIGPEGEVQHSHLLSSTGDTLRDAELIALLRVFRVQQAPPSSLSQPLTILILPDEGGGGSGTHCQRFEGMS